MTLSDRYLKGETQAVYEEIYALGEIAFDPAIFPQIDKVLRTTFHRAAFNIAVIYKGLRLTICKKIISAATVIASK